MLVPRFGRRKPLVKNKQSLNTHAGKYNMHPEKCA